MSHDDVIMFRELGIGFAIGAGTMFLWHLVSSLWGWRRGESYGYSLRHKSLYWDNPRFRHFLKVLSLIVAVAVLAVGWHFMADERLIGLFVGVLGLFFWPFPAHLLVLAFKLYAFYPSQGNGPWWRDGRPGGPTRGSHDGRES